MKKISFRKAIITVSFTLLSSFVVTGISAQANIPAAQQMKQKYTWNLRDIYLSQAHFDKDFATVEKEWLPQIQHYKGKLTNERKLLELLKLNEKISRKIDKLYLYAHLMQDLNIEDKTAANLCAKTEKLASEYSAAISFMKPEIISFSKEKWNKIKKNPLFKNYTHYLDSLYKRKEHMLSAKEEELLAKLSPIFGDAENIYNNASRGDYTPPIIQNNNGKKVKLTAGNFFAELEKSDREYRKKTYKAFFESYQSIKNTSAATLYASVKADEVYAKARHYKSGLDAALSSDHIPEHVFTNLISSVNNHLDYLHNYIELRRKVLKVDKVHGYDMYVPLVGQDIASQLKFPFDKAQKVILEGLAPLGKEYISHVKQAFQERWFDVYPRDKKYTGGYNTGTYDTHPFILLNYDDSLDEMLTVAHEIGHAMNSVYTNKAQNYYNSGQSIFTAEVASTANELIMMDYLINKAKTDEEKLFLLNKQIDNIRGTVFTQVMYSEFEKAIHDKVRNGGNLTAEELNKQWLDLLEKYYGKSFEVDEAAGVGWLRVPHFYNSFYVYKYATAMAAAYELVSEMKKDKTGKATERYIQFLSAGTSDDPIDILKRAGVDMTSPEPIHNILNYFQSLVKEMEEILKKQGKIE
jgi:oligoendopeptidase F